MPNGTWHLYLVNCFQEGMLEFGGPMGQCFNTFPTISQSSRGGFWGRGRRYGIDRKGRGRGYGIDSKNKFQKSHTAPTSAVGLCVA